MRPVLLTLALLSFARPIHGQGCNLPTALTTGTTSFSTLGGAPGTPCPFGPGHNFVGFRWTAPWSGPFAISTCMSGPPTDTVMAVRTPCGSPTVIACNDDNCDVWAAVSIQAQAGVEYEIDIGTFYSDHEVVDGRLTIAPAPNAGTGFCSGDGSATACPCNNVGAIGSGCGNNVEPRGAHLTTSSTTGIASIGSDTIRIGATGMPNAAALFFQGNTRVANGMGAVFGDGLSCVGGPIVRLGVVPVSGGNAYYPRAQDLPVSVRGMVSPGDVRHYQAWYRDPQPYCTAATFNYTQGRTLTWTN